MSDLASVLASEDPDVARVLELEDQRQRDCIVLIASENYANKAVLEPGASVISNKYAEGYPGRRYYGGCENADIRDSSHRSSQGVVWSRTRQCAAPQRRTG